MGNALATPDRWVRSWRRGTWVVVVWTLVVAAAYLWSEVQLASLCPDSVPDQAECRATASASVIGYVVYPIAFLWLIYLIAWATFPLWTRLRRLLWRLAHPAD